MRKSLLLASAAIVLVSSAAFAADLPSRKPAPAVVRAVPTFTWTGFYAGLNAGAAFNASKWSNAGGAPFASFNTDGNGFMGGAHIGYNYQINQFVAGLEGDFDALTVKGTGACGVIVGSRCQTKQEWVGSVRGRLGVAFDRVLVYTTGGVAFTEYKSSQSVPVAQRWTSSTRTGWVVGLGAEYAITNNLIAGLEWKYYDFGKKIQNGGVAPASVKFKESEHSVLARISYKF